MANILPAPSGTPFFNRSIAIMPRDIDETGDMQSVWQLFRKIDLRWRNAFSREDLGVFFDSCMDVSTAGCGSEEKRKSLVSLWSDWTFQKIKLVAGIRRIDTRDQYVSWEEFAGKYDILGLIERAKKDLMKQVKHLKSDTVADATLDSEPPDCYEAPSPPNRELPAKKRTTRRPLYSQAWSNKMRRTWIKERNESRLAAPGRSQCHSRPGSAVATRRVTVRNFAWEPKIRPCTAGKKLDHDILSRPQAVNRHGVLRYANKPASPLGFMRCINGFRDATQAKKFVTRLASSPLRPPSSYCFTNRNAFTQHHRKFKNRKPKPRKKGKAKCKRKQRGNITPSHRHRSSVRTASETLHQACRSGDTTTVSQVLEGEISEILLCRDGRALRATEIALEGRELDCAIQIARHLVGYTGKEYT